MSTRRRCKGKNKRGTRCKSTSLIGDTGYCFSHQPEEVKEKHGFGGAQPGAGRPRLPKPHELLREKIEGNLEKWLKPYEDALEAERPVVVDGVLEMVADHKARMQAPREVMDRIYGKPKQQLELGGSETPITAEIVHTDAREVADAAHEFLRKLAGGAQPGG